MCLDERESGRSNRSLDVWFAFNLRWAFTFLPFLSFLQPVLEMLQPSLFIL